MEGPVLAAVVVVRASGSAEQRMLLHGYQTMDPGLAAVGNVAVAPHLGPVRRAPAMWFA